MSAPSWTEAEDEWLRENYPLHGNRELEAMKAEDGYPRSANAIGQRARILGIRKDPAAGYERPHRMPLWGGGRAEWLVSFAPGHTEGEIADEFERLYGIRLSRDQIGQAKCRFGAKSGTHGGRFEPGHVPWSKGKRLSEIMSPEAYERVRANMFSKDWRPHNDSPLLTVRRDRDGYPQIKVMPRNAKNTMNYWISLGRFEWMRANGRDWPEGCVTVYVDGDPDNVDPENVVPVPNDLWPLINGATGTPIPYHDRESLEVAITSARVTRARRRLEAAVRSSR